MYIYCKNVVRAYRVGDHEIVALRGIDFTMEKGEMVSIVGPSGAGKSSLLNLLGGLDTPTAGKLSVGDLDLLELNRRQLADYRLHQVGFVWQQVSRNLLQHRSALHNVTLPMMLANVPYRQRMQRAKDLLEQVGLAEHLYKKPAQLSGGQQQRVAIAVALANEPQLLLADEPTGALDRKTAIQITELLNQIRKERNITVLMVTHDMELALDSDRTLTLRDGALGQDLSHVESEQLTLDEEGRIQLPELVRPQLSAAQRIAVEIRPEGILLRPENENNDHTEGLLKQMLETSTSQPSKRSWFKWPRLMRSKSL